MTKFSKAIYIVMVAVTVLGMLMDAFKAGHFDTWKFNTLCWVGIAWLNESRAAQAVKHRDELLKDIHDSNF